MENSLETEARDAQAAHWILRPTPSVAFCLAAGILTLVGLLATFPVFPLPDLPELGLSPSAEVLKLHSDAQLAFRSRNYAVVFGMLGLLMGVACGMATSQGKRLPSALAGGLAGSLAGAIAGYFAGTAVAGILSSGENQSLVQSGIWHFVVWAALAACIAFVIGFIHGGFKLAVTGGLIGLLSGIFVSLAWNLVGSIAFSKSNLIYLMPEKTVERIVWICASAAVLGAALSIGFKPAPPKPSAVAEVEDS